MRINLKIFRFCTGFNLDKEVYDSMSYHLLSIYPIKTIDRDKIIHRELFLKNISKKSFLFTDWKKYRQAKDLTIPTRSYFSQILPIKKLKLTWKQKIKRFVNTITAKRRFKGEKKE